MQLGSSKANQIGHLKGHSAK